MHAEKRTGWSRLKSTEAKKRGHEMRAEFLYSLLHVTRSTLFCSCFQDTSWWSMRVKTAHLLRNIAWQQMEYAVQLMLNTTLSMEPIQLPISPPVAISNLKPQQLSRQEHKLYWKICVTSFKRYIIDFSLLLSLSCVVLTPFLIRIRTGLTSPLQTNVIGPSSWW